MARWIEYVDDKQAAVILRLKVIPGAKRDEVSGLIGDRLKVRTSAPPEDGKANRAVVSLVARALGVKSRDVELRSGHASRDKTLRVTGVSVSDVVERLGLLF